MNLFEGEVGDKTGNIRSRCLRNGDNVYVIDEEGSFLHPETKKMREIFLLVP